MNRTRISLSVVGLVVAAGVALFVLAAGGSATSARSSVAANSAISVRQTSLGKTLTDANGRTLYLFAGDKPDVSNLSSAGRAFWPPFTSAIKPSATGGALAHEIGSVNGTSRTRQLTYNGHPLYYFVGDHQPGQTAGQGLNQFGAYWYVLSTAGTAITSAPKTRATSTSTGGASGYAY